MKKIIKKLPLVVVFGRTNVGKSTLFNALTESGRAIVSDIEGTTRDANLNTVEWQNHEFELVDTGGIINLDQFLNPKQNRETDIIQAKIEAKAKSYLEKADVVLFLVDAKAGLLPQDRSLAILIKKLLNHKIDKVMLVVNKVDNYRRQGSRASEFHQLALGEPLTVSATTGSGTGDLLDRVVNFLADKNKFKKVAEVEEAEIEEIKVIMIGKPNVGKSSLFNSILGEERVIVSPIAHTTREPQDTVIEYKNKTIRIIDTAGISRQGQRSEKKFDPKKLEKLGIEQSLTSLAEADIALFIVDASEPYTHQDAKVVEEILERQKSLIIIGNKWDLIEDKDTKKYTLNINRKFPFAIWAPIHFLSAKTGSKVNKLLDLIIKVSDGRKIKLNDTTLNTFMMKIVKIHLPAKAKGVKHPHIKRFTQLRSNPPMFEVRIGAKDTLHFSYVRFISNRLREKFGFLGTPIRVWVSKNKKVHGQQNAGREQEIFVPMDENEEDIEKEIMNF
ncbi:MAG: ribosome biogenesis GTPase Der [bacterium]